MRNLLLIVLTVLLGTVSSGFAAVQQLEPKITPKYYSDLEIVIPTGISIPEETLLSRVLGIVGVFNQITDDLSKKTNQLISDKRFEGKLFSDLDSLVNPLPLKEKDAIAAIIESNKEGYTSVLQNLQELYLQFEDTDIPAHTKHLYSYIPEEFESNTEQFEYESVELLPLIEQADLNDAVEKDGVKENVGLQDKVVNDVYISTIEFLQQDAIRTQGTWATNQDFFGNLNFRRQEVIINALAQALVAKTLLGADLSTSNITSASGNTYDISKYKTLKEAAAYLKEKANQAPDVTPTLPSSANPKTNADNIEGLLHRHFEMSLIWDQLLTIQQQLLATRLRISAYMLDSMGGIKNEFLPVDELKTMVEIASKVKNQHNNTEVQQ